MSKKLGQYEFCHQILEEGGPKTGWCSVDSEGWIAGSHCLQQANDSEEAIIKHLAATRVETSPVSAGAGFPGGHWIPHNRDRSSGQHAVQWRVQMGPGMLTKLRGQLSWEKVSVYSSKHPCAPICKMRVHTTTGGFIHTSARLWCFPEARGK